ncbi:MAG: site-specific DNA methylase [uncultured marine phage]|uniref:Site-specific DNA methylase n=1 Tax=uncultured marine phage TaxID=707152 RepID=A0A8D9FRV9_9VIRU|nr:MAG: site-specific DNA methylase [uncultured marine phage]
MLSYIGGKSRIGKWIQEYIPEGITTYVEPFSGMYWVYFNMNLEKYPNLETIVYNDFNPVNCNLFASLQNPEEFYDYIKDIPCQTKDKLKEGDPCDPKFREVFSKYQKHAFDGDFDLTKPDFERAMNYAYVLSQVFSGSKPETSSFIDLKHKYRSKFDTFRDKVGGVGRGKKFKAYLGKITDVENMDFEDVIKKYDSPTTYFYVDPPYWKTENYYSNHDFDREDHERLAKCLKSMEGKFSLSYYDFPLLSEWFPKDEYVWIMKEFAKAASAKAGKTQNMGEELLIMNY